MKFPNKKKKLKKQFSEKEMKNLYFKKKLVHIYNGS